MACICQEPFGLFGCEFTGTTVIGLFFSLLVIPVGDSMDGPIFRSPFIEQLSGRGWYIFKRNGSLAAMLAYEAGFPHIAR